MLNNFKNLFLDVFYYFFKRTSKVDYETFGVNCFFNQAIFPSNNLNRQASDISTNLKLKYVRVLFNWNDLVQPSKNSKLDLSFYDNIIEAGNSRNLKYLIVLNGCPSWNKNKIGSIKLFEEYCYHIIDRYSQHEHVLGYQVLNETNTAMFDDNVEYSFINNPELYVNALANVYNYSKKINPSKIITNAATTSILQSFPRTLEYNKKLLEYGLEKYIDVYSFHYYGDSLFNLLRPSGVFNFIRSISKPLWITEIGEKKFNNHLQYYKKHINFLKHRLNLEKIFWYQYDGGADTSSYGLIIGSTLQKSKLYNHIKNS